MRLKRKVGKQLGGQAPRKRGRWQRDPSVLEAERGRALLSLLAVGMFVVGVVAGYAWSLDRKIRGGILQQQAEAARRPDWVELRSLPPYVPATFLAVVEPEQLPESALRPPAHRTTLARELVQQVHMLPGSLGGDAQGLVMGPVLEQHLRGPRLVELYLNRVYLGRNRGVEVYGIWHGAREYFDKEPQQLTLSETATLAGLLLPPRIEEPKSRIGAVGTRRNEVLRVMLAGGLIGEEEYRQALSEPLGFQPGLEQLPMSRPADWASAQRPIRLPPNLRPVPKDSTSQAPGAGR